MSTFKQALENIFVVAIAAFIVMLTGVPNLRLVATDPGLDGKPLAIIEDTDSGRQEVFQLTNNVFQHGDLVEIDSNKVIIRKNNQLIAIEGRGAIKLSQEAISIDSKLLGEIQLAASSSAVISSTDVNTEQLPQINLSNEQVFQFIEATATDPSADIDRAQPQVITDGGKIIGVSFANLEDDNIFSHFGLESGDILQSIDGEVITQVDSLFDFINAEADTEIQVRRGDHTFTLKMPRE